MLRNYIIHAIALTVAPLFVGLGTGLSFYIHLPNDFKKLIEDRGLFAVLGPNVYELPITYGIVLLLGLPAYLLLKKLNLAKAPIIIAYAALIGFVMSLIFADISSRWESFVFPSIIVSAVAVFIVWVGNLTSSGTRTQ